MPNKNQRQPNTIELTSYLWRELFMEIGLPHNGTVIEVAPGYEPKIGNALGMLGFGGTIILIEPDPKAARHIQKTYQRILPHATVKTIVKPLQDAEVGVDILLNADALVASHPFDDMVMSYIVDGINFFSKEKKGGANMSPFLKKLYRTIKDENYTDGVQTTVKAWQHFIENAKPNHFMASQYPSHTLTIKGLAKRQQSGYRALKELKHIYKHSLVQQRLKKEYGSKGDPKWWIIAKNPASGFYRNTTQEPRAFKRLGKSLFVPQYARRLRPDEYDIMYADKNYFGNINSRSITKQAREFAIVLNNKKRTAYKKIVTYADLQKDKSGIGLSGNIGSGRAVYYGAQHNILGVGKTTLCASKKQSHSTGRLECIGAMRRIILSQWINYFSKRAPAHPLLIALKKTARYKWNPNPIPLCLLVREDNGCLDRPSHVEASPNIPVNFEKTLTEYAKLDAEYFAYRFMLGAWSTSNYSLTGHIIDLESATFVKYRGPYYTSSSTHPHNRFGYEGLGFIKILRQLARIKNIKTKNIESRFCQKRRAHLGLCFLLLLGIEKSRASPFFLKHQRRVMNISDRFETSAKKVSPATIPLNLYMPIQDDQDPALLDMSCLFRNLANLYQMPRAEEKALEIVVRKKAYSAISSDISDTPTNRAETYVQKRAVVHKNQIGDFLHDTKDFICALFKLLSLLDTENCLGKKELWDIRLRAMNQNVPPMHELNTTLRFLIDSYRRGIIPPHALGLKLETFCALPKRPASI